MIIIAIVVVVLAGVSNLSKDGQGTAPCSDYA